MKQMQNETTATAKTKYFKAIDQIQPGPEEELKTTTIPGKKYIFWPYNNGLWPEMKTKRKKKVKQGNRLYLQCN